MFEPPSDQGTGDDSSSLGPAPSREVAIVLADKIEIDVHLDALRKREFRVSQLGEGAVPFQFSAEIVVFVLSAWRPDLDNLFKATAAACRLSNSILVVASTHVDQSLMEQSCSVFAFMVVELKPNNPDLLARRLRAISKSSR